MMQRLLLSGLIAVLFGTTACVTDYDPYAAYSAEERAKLQADAELRRNQAAEAQQQLQYQDTITDEQINQALAEGATRPLEGIKSRGLDVFDGIMAGDKEPYHGYKYYRYAKGTYRANPSPYSMQPQQGVYQGTFKFLVDKAFGENSVHGTYVMIGTFTRHDGVVDKGIYVAERVYTDLPIAFTKATPAYLSMIEKKFEKQVVVWKEEQIRLAKAREEAARRVQQQRRNSNSGFNFGKMLALGLGGMMIATSDIPSADRLEIGSAFFQDVMNGDEATAMREVIQQKSAGSYLPSRIGGSAGVNGTARTATTQTAAGTAASGGSSKTTQYTFKCPSGTSGSVSISYKTSACLSAKQQMTRIYSCNLIDDFGEVSGICSSGCGSPNCTD